MAGNASLITLQVVLSVSKDKDSKSLVQGILEQLGGPGAASTPQTASEASLVDPTLSPDDQARELTDLYFDLEDPVERDVVFDKLAALDSDIVREFFASMMDHDEDDYLRAAAAAELARRGDAEALARLEDEVQDPSDLTLFTQALHALAELRGQAFYEVAAAVWRDAAREGAERREAMQVLESLDVARALQDFLAWISDITDVHTLADDLVEVAMAAFVRHDFQAALPVLQALRGRILAATWEAPEEGAELAAFVNEGIALLTAV